MASVERGADGSLDLAAVKSAYERHGWVALPSLFSSAELAPMISRLEQRVDAIAQSVGAEPAPPNAPFDRYLLDVLEQLDERGEERPALSFTPFHIEEGDGIGGRGQEVFDLVAAPQLLDVLRALLGDAVTYSYAGLCRCRLPDASGPRTRYGLPFPMHQDSQYYDSVNWDDGTTKPGLEHSTARVHIVSAWMPLVDTDEHNGALRLISGSHRWGMFAGERDEDSNMRAYAGEHIWLPTYLGAASLRSPLR